MREASATQAGSTLGSGAAAVSEVPSAPVVKKLLLPSAAHPASSAPARTSAIDEARRLDDMGSTPERCSLLRLTRCVYILFVCSVLFLILSARKLLPSRLPAILGCSALILWTTQ